MSSILNILVIIFYYYYYMEILYKKECLIIKNE